MYFADNVDDKLGSYPVQITWRLYPMSVINEFKFSDRYCVFIMSEELTSDI